MGKPSFRILFLYLKTNIVQYYNQACRKVKNLGGQVVMRRATAARRRLLIRQNLGGGGQLAPLPLPLPTCLL